MWYLLQKEAGSRWGEHDSGLDDVNAELGEKEVSTHERLLLAGGDLNAYRVTDILYHYCNVSILRMWIADGLLKGVARAF